MKKRLISTSLIAALAAFQPAFAHEGEDHGAAKTEHAEATKTPSKAATAQEALTEIQTEMTAIDGIVAGGKGDALHPEIEKVEASAEALKAKAALDADKKTRLEAALKQLNAQLGKLHNAVDKGDKTATDSELKKAHSAMKLVENALK